MLLIAVICRTVAAVIQFWRDQPDAGSIDGRDQARLFHPGDTAVRFAQDSLLEGSGFLYGLVSQHRKRTPPKSWAKALGYYTNLPPSGVQIGADWDPTIAAILDA